jgi:hypothetical protein
MTPACNGWEGGPSVVNPIDRASPSTAHTWMENVKHIARTISYPSRESISTRATQHLVDADDVKWVDSHTHMESWPDVLVTYLVAQM